MKRTAKAVALIPTLLMILALTTACGSAMTEPPQTEPTEAAAGDVSVEMKGIKFQPARVTVKRGARVTFANKDGMVHDVVQVAVQGLGKERPGFDSGGIKPGESWSVVMEKPGTYPILCTQMNHYTAGMVGSITVVE